MSLAPSGWKPLQTRLHVDAPTTVIAELVVPRNIPECRFVSLDPELGT